MSEKISEPTSEKLITVKDEFDNVYKLVEPIGEGGQGTVWRTNIPNILIKISNEFRDENELKARIKQINRIKRTIPEDFKISKPKALLNLNNRVGYVMEMMDGLQPLSQLIESVYDANRQLSTENYLKTGGLYRRLMILADLSATLARLHALGLSYGDLSPANIFISTSVEYHQVWLIDVDNISYHEASYGKAFYTHGYASPEIIREESGTNISTDCWSFAVIALELLAHLHPYYAGYAIVDEEPETVQPLADKGEYPWVFDAKDDSNHTDTGFPLPQMINPSLMNLFERCFGESRVYDTAYVRPSMSEWHEELNRTCNLILQCPSCQSTFLSIEREINCPFCHDTIAQQDILILRPRLILRNEDELTGRKFIDIDEAVIITQGQTKYIYRQPFSYFDKESLDPWCTLTLNDVGLMVKPNGIDEISLKIVDGKQATITKPNRLKYDIKTGKVLMLINHTIANDYGNIVWCFKW